MKTVPIPEGQGWIEFLGDECPVDEEILVDVLFRDGGQDYDLAGVWEWGPIFDRPKNIIAYRIRTV